MATKIFLGSQQDIKQVSSFTISTYDAASTYILTVGAGNLTEVISVVADTDATVTATALAAAWNASTHPWCKYITATSATDTVTLTADNKGAPFTVVSSKTGGAGVFDSEVVVTANQSGSDVDDTANYAGGSKAGNNDTFIHARGAPALAWGLDQSAITGVTFHHPRGAGNVGLDRMAFAISSDGQTVDGDAREYRDHYFKMDMEKIFIGQEGGPTAIAAATRIKIDNTRTGAGSATRVYSVAGVSIDSGLPTLRMLANHAATDFIIASCVGGFGVAADSLDETSTIGDVSVDDDKNVSKIVIGEGCTWANYDQVSGDAKLRGAASPTTIKASGGTVETFGTFSLTSCTITIDRGATYYYSSDGGISAVNNNGGTLNAARNGKARTITDYNPKIGSVIILDGANVTIANWNAPANLHTVTYS